MDRRNNKGTNEERRKSRIMDDVRKLVMMKEEQSVRVTVNVMAVSLASKNVQMSSCDLNELRSKSLGQKVNNICP